MAGLSGCHSAYIEAAVTNQTAAPISLVQVEYPSASFGTQSIASGQTFKYRFKILGSGQMKIVYTGIAGKEYKSTGPELVEGTEGTLNVVITESGVQWEPALATR